MRNVYCTKCGIRGSSKCPNCRSIFSESPKGDDSYAQEYFEMFMSVGLKNKDDREKLAAGEDVRFNVTFWTYEKSEDAAIKSVLHNLRHWLAKANLDVAACVHDWQLMPGEKSSIGCGCEGPPVGTPVPDDPYA